MILTTKLSLIIYFILILSKFHYTNGKVTLNLITFSFEKDSKYIDEITNEFNAYSEENNLDIYLQKTLLTSDNITIDIDSYANTIESLLSKKSVKYDLIMVNAVYVHRFDNYVLDLNCYISKEIRDLYSNSIVQNIGVRNNKLIALPLYHDVGVFFSNRKYLGKYNITPPETWDELIEKASIILKSEEKQGNTDLIGYLGNFPESDAGIASTFEFIHSFRESRDSPTPSFNSNEAHRALKKIKEIKEKISSDDSFRISEDKIVQVLLSQKVLFGRFWKIDLGMYQITPLPGEKKGVSASWVNGYYLMINKFIKDENKLATAKVIEFFLSKDFQINHAIKNNKVSGSETIYDDDFLCQNIDCKFIKSLQFIARISETAHKNDFVNGISLSEFVGQRGIANSTQSVGNRRTGRYNIENGH